VPPVESVAADFAEADIAAGPELIGMAAAPLPLAHFPPHVAPCQGLPVLCEIRSCFALDSALIPEAFWHRTRPALLRISTHSDGPGTPNASIFIR
jgi:hypothetical protein